MFGKYTMTILKSKYNINIKDYIEEDQIEILKRVIERRDQIIDINNKKKDILEEITDDISEFISGGKKVASK